MALTEPTAPRTVRWANVIGTVAIKASTTVAAGDPLGYSSGWVPADANATYDAIVFAVGPGEGGETIQIADSICLQGFTLGTVGGAVFLSDTAGDYSETPSTTSPQCVGRILAADMIVANAHHEVHLVSTQDFATAAIPVIFFIANRRMRLVAVREVHTTASTSGTLQVEKLNATDAPGAGDSMLAQTISTAGTANTPVAGTLSATAANLLLEVGDRMALVSGGTQTNLVGCIVSCALVPA